MKVSTPEAPPKGGTKSAIKGTSWGNLEPGQVVTLEKGNHRITGSIDALTEDGHILWIISSTGERRLFHIDDGYAPFPALPEPS
jgi:hypothetical protein